VSHRLDASGWHRKWTESIRRHQHPSNARLSGWTGPEDQRRRIVHFYDEYALVGRSFVLQNAYLWLHLSLPKEQIEGYQALIETGLRDGDWRADGVEDARGLRQQRFRRGDLVLRIAYADVHPEDQKRQRALPAGYRSLELWLETDGYRVPSGWHERPWRVFFDVGCVPRWRGEPELELERLSELFAGAARLGCGPSIAAGVPHSSNRYRICVSLPGRLHLRRPARRTAR
jgi:hypothetical protein